ncbi:DUF551 domain-containing protein [Cronobacter sakazakii]|uniref:DUF551 domain-containing protein n=1 Tax=Cronobacter sakazakii TaxID=28141 RepID=A0AA45C2W2_CROSK|nr:DUF551 domain-containing protein [Cronobacter sakazakii]PUW06853.1 DUF551 domain-containing protein [Cronobacter sakazakii]
MSEISEVIASEIADFFAGFGGPGEPDIQSGEAQRLLTERVLSVLALRERAEPVAYADPQAFRNFQAGTAKKEWVWAKPDAGLVPVFVEAPPAPVVPEGLRIALSNAGIAAPESDEMLWASQKDYIQMLVTWVKDRKPFKHTQVVPAETFDEWSRRCEIQLTLCRPEFREVAEITWNACRAAMLAAPPAPVTAGWIACSERMPELNTRVLLYFPDYGGHIEDGCIGDEGDGPYHYFFDGDSLRHEPTHWMPLPEAPATN